MFGRWQGGRAATARVGGGPGGAAANVPGHGRRDGQMPIPGHHAKERRTLHSTRTERGARGPPRERRAALGSGVRVNRPLARTAESDDRSVGAPASAAGGQPGAAFAEATSGLGRAPGAEPPDCPWIVEEPAKSRATGGAEGCPRDAFSGPRRLGQEARWPIVRASHASEPRERSGAKGSQRERVGGLRGAKPPGQIWRARQDSNLRPPA